MFISTIQDFSKPMLRITFCVCMHVFYFRQQLLYTYMAYSNSDEANIHFSFVMSYKLLILTQTDKLSHCRYQQSELCNSEFNHTVFKLNTS